MYQLKLNQKNNAFTLLELLIVISVITILAAIILTPLAQFRASKLLDTTANEIVSILAEARANTISSKNDSQYGVHFESNRIILFTGAVFNAADPNNVEITIDPVLELSDIAITGGGSDIVFDRITGATSDSATLTLHVVSDPSRSAIITVTPAGIASIE